MLCQKSTVNLKLYARVFRGAHLAGAYPTLERVCAHLILTNSTSEILVAFLVAKNWYVGHIEDSLISRPLKKRRRKELLTNV